MLDRRGAMVRDEKISFSYHNLRTYVVYCLLIIYSDHSGSPHWKIPGACLRVHEKCRNIGKGLTICLDCNRNYYQITRPIP